VVAYVTQSLLEGKEALCSDGTQMRDFLHVADVASAFVSMLGNDVCGAVNIGSGRAVALREVLANIGELTGRPELLCFGQRSSAGEAPAFWANNQRLLECGWTPRYDLKQGLAETEDWWRNSGKVQSATAPPQR
jgi:nucleoside-diphosphate-sugar epimerase